MDRLRIAQELLKTARLLLGFNPVAIKENDVVKVYHGTQNANIPFLLNGFDANKKMSRRFNAPSHSGLFVSPTLAGTGKFGNTVLELVVRAKNLHGTNYGGDIGRRQGLDPDTEKWLEDKYPKSFRPTLSDSLLDGHEPQAILRGLVSPRQIKRVLYEGKWYSRSAFLELGIGKTKDVGMNLSSPDYSLDEFFTLVGKIHRKPASKIESAFRKMNRSKREKELERQNFGPTAVRSYLKKMDTYFGQD